MGKAMGACLENVENNWAHNCQLDNDQGRDMERERNEGGSDRRQRRGARSGDYELVTTRDLQENGRPSTLRLIEQK